MPHSAASDLGLHCLPMSHKKDACRGLYGLSSPILLLFLSFLDFFADNWLILTIKPIFQYFKTSYTCTSFLHYYTITEHTCIKVLRKVLRIQNYHNFGKILYF